MQWENSGLSERARRVKCRLVMHKASGVEWSGGVDAAAKALVAGTLKILALFILFRAMNVSAEQKTATSSESGKSKTL